MGSGKWSTDVYKQRETARKKSGASAFAYHDQARKSGQLRAHPSLDPHGVKYRESRDSNEHPDSNSIAVMLDVTGSMGVIPRALQQDLPQLLGLLLKQVYVPHPQILFGAVGDAYSDRVPLQVGQFESDNRMDQNLQDIIIEGGGGGQGKESYDLALYFMARHTAFDCWEKRRKKGYFFMVGDELAYTHVSKDQVKSVIGDNIKKDIPLPDIIGEVKEKFNLFYIVPTGASPSRTTEVLGFWREMVGANNVLTLEDPESIAEIIALTIGINEGNITLEQGLNDLQQFEVGIAIMDSVKASLSAFTGDQASVKGSGNLDLDSDGSGGTRRL